jgi:excisionase family DNA binding protein
METRQQNGNRRRCRALPWRRRDIGVKELGELDVSAATVCRWVRDGTISAKRFGQRIIRIPRVEVERLLEKQ